MSVRKYINFCGLSATIHWASSDHTSTVHVFHEACVRNEVSAGISLGIRIAFSKLVEFIVKNFLLRPSIEVMIYSFWGSILH